MTTIYLLEQGRLGNQMFQLLAARIFDRHAKIIMIGGVDLNRYFLSFKGISQIYHKSHPAFFLWSLSWLVRKFAHYGLIGYVQESFNSQKHQLFHYSCKTRRLFNLAISRFSGGIAGRILFASDRTHKR